MSEDLKLPSAEELLEMANQLGKYADVLAKDLEAEQQKTLELNTESASWLTAYLKLQSQFAALEKRVRQLEAKS